MAMIQVIWVESHFFTHDSYQHTAVLLHWVCTLYHNHVSADIDTILVCSHIFDLPNRLNNQEHIRWHLKRRKNKLAESELVSVVNDSCQQSWPNGVCNIKQLLTASEGNIKICLPIIHKV